MSLLSSALHWCITTHQSCLALLLFNPAADKTLRAANMDFKRALLFFPLFFTDEYRTEIAADKTSTEDMLTEQLIPLNLFHSLNFEGNSCNHLWVLILASDSSFLMCITAFVFVLWSAPFKAAIHQDPIAKLKKNPFLNFTPRSHSPLSPSSNQRFPIRNKLSLYCHPIQEHPKAPTIPWKADASSGGNFKEKICFGTTWIQLRTRKRYINLGKYLA